MSGQGKNAALRGLLDEAEMSHSAVVAAGAREGKHLGTNTTSVRRMLDGCQPRWPAPRLGRVPWIFGRDAVDRFGARSP
jgi:hypothetical protein